MPASDAAFINERASESRDTVWRQHLASLGQYELEVDVASVLKQLFPPSAHACYGADALTRTCHYTNVVAHQSRFYYVVEQLAAAGG